MVTAAVPGPESGSTILMRLPKREEPSTKAASSSSRGMASKKPSNIQVAKICRSLAVLWIMTSLSPRLSVLWLLRHLDLLHVTFVGKRFPKYNQERSLLSRDSPGKFSKSSESL